MERGESLSKSLQIRLVTGRGFAEDEEIAGYEVASEDVLTAAAQKANLAHVGNLLDFIAVEQIDELLRKGECCAEDVIALKTCWNGRPLEPGIFYGLVSEDTDHLAQLFATHKMQGQAGSDHLVSADRGQALWSTLQAQQHKGAAAPKAAPEGGAFKKKRRNQNKP